MPTIRCHLRCHLLKALATPVRHPAFRLKQGNPRPSGVEALPRKKAEIFTKTTIPKGPTKHLQRKVRLSLKSTIGKISKNPGKIQKRKTPGKLSKSHRLSQVARSSVRSRQIQLPPWLPSRLPGEKAEQFAAAKGRGLACKKRVDRFRTYVVWGNSSV